MEKERAEVFDRIKDHGEHEKVIFCSDEKTGLKAIIAIHNTILGPALGGTRMWDYKSEQEALVDVLRLSRGMTYKAASCGLNLGGGKAVIIGDPRKDKTEGILKSFGDIVESLKGKYITSKDVGISSQDLDVMATKTSHIVGFSEEKGGYGDPSPYTAHGVFMGLRACMEFQFKTPQFKGKRIALQGLGAVGKHLLRYLLNEGAEVIATDINQESIEKQKEKFPQIQTVSPKKIYDVECDVFVPCAMGAVVNQDTLKRFSCKIIAGGANNQLESPELGRQIREKGILYAPDYVINAGGLMFVEAELNKIPKEVIYKRTEAIYTNLKKIFEISEKKNLSTNEASIRLVHERLGQGKKKIEPPKKPSHTKELR